MGDLATRPYTVRHAVILAAGESKRTRPLTTHRPKPLIPLLDRPLLAHILDELVGLVEHVTLVVGYRAEQIEAAFGATYRGMALRYAYQSVMNGTAGAVLAMGRIEEPFLLIYGDNLIARADVLGVSRSRYGVAGLHVPDARSFGVLQIEDGLVRSILEKPPIPPPNALANPGIYRFDEAVFPLLEQIKPSSRGELELTDLIGVIAERAPVLPHVCVGHWVPVGTPWEALSAAQFLAAGRPEGPVFVHPEASLHPSAQIIGPSVIGPGALIGADATIDASVVGPGATVGEGATVQYSWLDDGARVGAKAMLAARIFAELQPNAEVRGALTPSQLITRGAILGRNVNIAPGIVVEPGSILAS